MTSHRIAKAWWVVWLAMGVAALPGRASAQDGPPRLTIAAGAGDVRPLARELGGSGAVAWSLDVETSLTRHLLVGVLVAGWRDTTPPTRLEGEFAQNGSPIDAASRLAVRFVGLSAFASASVGRARFSSGAAVGHAGITAQQTFTVENCPPAELTQCEASTDAQSSSGFAVQGLLGIDVRLTRRLQVFAIYSLMLPATPGYANVGLTAGLRVRVK